MPSVSNKGLSMPQSPIRKLVPFAENAKKRGINVIHLNIGQPDIKTPQQALDAVKNNNLSVLEYSRTEGSEEFRTKIAKYYEKYDIHVSATDLIVTTVLLILTMKLLFLNRFMQIITDLQLLVV